MTKFYKNFRHSFGAILATILLLIPYVFLGKTWDMLPTILLILDAVVIIINVIVVAVRRNTKQ